MIPILLFAAPSGSGKSLYISSLIPRLREKGLRRVGFLKHHHGAFYENRIKDTGKMIHAGAIKSLLIATDIIVMEEPAPKSENNDISIYLEKYFYDCDLVIIEGFKKNTLYPKVVILGTAKKDYIDWFNKIKGDKNIIAVISEKSVNVPYPVFGMKEKDKFCDFIITHFNLLLASLTIVK